MAGEINKLKQVSQTAKIEEPMVVEKVKSNKDEELTKVSAKVSTKNRTCVIKQKI